MEIGIQMASTKLYLTLCAIFLQFITQSVDGFESAMSAIEDVNINATKRFSEIDILYTDEQMRQLEDLKSHARRNRRGVIKRLNRRWENGIVNYIFLDIFDQTEQRIIQDSINSIEKNTCIRFNELDFPLAPANTNYIGIFKGSGCYSYVGMINIGKQVLSLDENCVDTRIVTHEFLHALGFFHEQSRPDRDQYIKIIKENIIPGDSFRRQFDIINAIDSRGSEYDINSIMHYGKYHFSIEKKVKPTIESLNGEPIGGDKLTASDIDQINSFYNCPTTTAIPSTTTTSTTTEKLPTTTTPTITEISSTTITSTTTDIPSTTITSTATEIPSTTTPLTKTDIPSTTITSTTTEIPSTATPLTKTDIPSTTITSTTTEIPSTTTTSTTTEKPSTTITSTTTEIPSTTTTPTTNEIPSTTISSTTTEIPSTTTTSTTTEIPSTTTTPTVNKIPSTTTTSTTTEITSTNTTSTTTEILSTNTTSTTTKTPDNSKTCQDKSTVCKTLSKIYCLLSTKIKTLCQESCDVCNTKPELACSDKQDLAFCDDIALNIKCIGIFESLCPRSCCLPA